MTELQLYTGTSVVCGSIMIAIGLALPNLIMAAFGLVLMLLALFVSSLYSQEI